MLELPTTNEIDYLYCKKFKKSVAGNFKQGMNTLLNLTVFSPLIGLIVVILFPAEQLVLHIDFETRQILTLHLQ